MNLRGFVIFPIMLDFFSEKRGWQRPFLWQVVILLIMFGLALTSMIRQTPTFDEQGFITRGLGYLRGENRYMRVGHPLGLNALSAAFLATDEDVKLPIDHPSWAETNFHRPSELFLWEIGNDVEYVMFLARLPTIWLGLLLAALVGRWAQAMSGSRWAGLLALGLIALDPNILAHTQLATTDLGLAAGATVAGFTLWRFLKRPSWTNAIIAGIGFGLLQNTKFTAGLFVPLFALVIVVYVGFTTYDLRLTTYDLRSTLIKLLTAYPLAAFLTLWAAYGFQIGTLPDNLPVLSQLSGLTVPLSHHLEQLLDIGGRLQVATPSFLLGQTADSGWWTYFPVAFALKTPLLILILLLVAFVLRMMHYALRIKKRQSRHKLSPINDAALLIPALGYFAIALTSDVNLGYRHLLPILPFFAIFIATTLHFKLPTFSQFTIHNSQFTILSLILLAISTLWIHPHFLSYFNLLAGGPDSGWRYLVDSNIDWGQDLAGLRTWMDENDVANVWLSYFGEARPEYYGISYTGLDSWPPRLMNPEARPFYPHDPAPGIYAISATNLQGVHFADPDQFAWFRQREPVAKIGYSIFLYEVPATGPPVDLALGGVQLDEIAPADYALLGTNDVTPHWFDPAQSMLWPPDNNRWLALAKDTAVHPELVALMADWKRMAESDTYTLFRLPALNTMEPVRPLPFSQGDGRIVLLQIDLAETAVAPGETISLTTTWRQDGAPQPVKIFVHVLDASGDILTQWDGLGAVWEGWREGDTLLQTHQLSIPDGTPSGAYEIWAGLYHPNTNGRWQTEDGRDRIFLGELIVGAMP